MQLYLDCDGVLANFDKRGTEILGELPKTFQQREGDDEMWRIIKSKAPNFWLELDMMTDAYYLFYNVQHLDPIILTGVPRQMEESEKQKRLWVDKNFGTSQKLICCRVSQKSQFCQKNDVLIDDRVISKKKWEKAGGIFILHTSAKKSLDELKFLGHII